MFLYDRLGVLFLALLLATRSVIVTLLFRDLTQYSLWGGTFSFRLRAPIHSVYFQHQIFNSSVIFDFVFTRIVS
jgi:hypothetical protein